MHYKLIRRRFLVKKNEYNVFPHKHTLQNTNKCVAVLRGTPLNYSF